MADSKQSWGGWASYGWNESKKNKNEDGDDGWTVVSSSDAWNASGAWSQSPGCKRWKSSGDPKVPAPTKERPLATRAQMEVQGGPFACSATGAEVLDPDHTFHCTHCENYYTFFSQMAYLDEKNAFLEVRNASVKKAIALATKDSENPVQWEKEDSTQKTFLTCYKCCEGFHNEVYLNSETGKLTSKFRNKADLSKGQCNEYRIGRHIDHIAKKHKDETSTMPPLREIYAACEDQRVRRAADWIQQFGPGFDMQYGCGLEHGCGTYPLKTSGWWLMNAKKELDGSHSGGFWVCANCILRYSAK